MLSPLQIGPYIFETPLALSPMAGVSDKPFRQICREAGAGFAYSEMLTSKPELWLSKKSQNRFEISGELSPRILQIAGTEPLQMAKAANHAVTLGAQIIDINMGCPAKKVCNKLAGSALMKDELLVDKILSAVVRAVNVPVMLKTRTGWNLENQNVLTIAKIAEENGIKAIAIHGRTREDAYKGKAKYELIAEVKQKLDIPVLANGDVDSPQKAAYVLKQTGADGLLIGRAAQGQPWIFKQIGDFLTENRLTAAPSLAEIRDIVLKHLKLIYLHYGSVTGTRIARKHIGWYLQGQFEHIRKQVNHIDEPEKQYKVMQQFYGELIAAYNNNEVIH